MLQMFHRLLLVAVALGCLTPLVASMENEDQKLADFFKKALDEELRQRPVTATQLGDHRFDHLMDDLSPKARAGWTERTRAALADLSRSVDYAKLSRSAQIDFEILRHHWQSTIWLDENTQRFAEDPRVYNEYLSDSIYLPFVQSTLPKQVTLKNCAARLAHIPAVVSAARQSLKNPPRVVVETAIRQNRGTIGFYERGLFTVAGVASDHPELAPAAQKMLPILRDYQRFLEDELLPRANGEWRIGKDKFARKLEFELNTGLTADELLHEAEVEAERVEREMYVLARQVWSELNPKQVLPPDDDRGRRATVQQVLSQLARNHSKVEELVGDAQKIVAEIKTFIRAKDILRLPEPDRCQVIEMPEFQRGNSVAFLNPAPPLDPQAASVYAISPPPSDWDLRRVNSYLEEYNRSMMHLLSIHEGYPGHYVQLEYSNRHPSLIRKVLSSGVFAEGWAVYTEQMMLDQGYGNGNVALRLHQLKFYLRAVTNAILDHKMHCTNMSDDEALKFLTQRAFQSEGEALAKIIRAKQSSCQLSTYFAGRTAFYRLRQRMQRELGDKFDLGRYHEAVLDHGTLPVKYLPELVAERLKQPR